MLANFHYFVLRFSYFLYFTILVLHYCMPLFLISCIIGDNVDPFENRVKGGLDLNLISRGCIIA